MSEPLQLFVDALDTPTGRFTIAVDLEGRLRAAGWLGGGASLERDLRAFMLTPRVDPFGITSAVRGYFEGERSAIDRIPVVAAGTAFQCAVWEALRDIPCGETRSYRQLACAIGRPTAVRAVGLANGANPIAVIVPCHRVIGADGSLTGYGGGLERKRWLLAHERRPLEETLELWRAR
jgi:methylated-DNA-[protein]-cysteine S-methyltransferase